MPCSTTMKRANKPPALQSAESRDRILREIADRKGIAKEVEAEYIAWSIPKTHNDDSTRGKAENVRINLLGLCSPGAELFGQTHGSCNEKLARFTSTPETRCVRDIKRIFSWKIYGVACSTLCPTQQAHYVRISFQDSTKDYAFAQLSTLLDNISAKRHVALPNIRPFGVGVDVGVPEDHDHIYLINNCAKQTPFVRKVDVFFEVHINGSWERVCHKVDRIGFATYSSACKRNITTSPGPEDVHFTDDPYVRFGRMTLRFGDRPERTYIDLEGGEKSIPHISRTRKGSVVYLPKVRVRTSDSATRGEPPARTMIRLIFREKDSGFLRGAGYAKNAAPEAEKLANLIRKTTHLAARNCLGIRHSVNDNDIIPLPVVAVESLRSYIIKLPGNTRAHRANISDKFCDKVQCYAVPTHRTDSKSGIALITQTCDGGFVIRQHIEDPVELIASISSRGFTVTAPSSLATAKTGSRVPASGGLRYTFATGDTDATRAADKLVKLVTSVDAQQDAPSRLPVLKQLLVQKKRSGYSPAVQSPTHYSHSRSGSDASACSDVSDVSLTESIDSMISAFAREPSDWDIWESKSIQEADLFDDMEPAVVEEPAPLSLSRKPSVLSLSRKPSTRAPPQALQAGQVARAKEPYKASLPREVTFQVGDPVFIEYKNNNWSFVRLIDGDKGWCPTTVLEVG